MLELTIKQAKDFFFVDRAGRARIFAGVDRARHKALTAAGAMVRRVARNSIRPARRKKLSEIDPAKRWRYDKKRMGSDALPRPWAPSEPGQPPRSRTGLLKKFIFFAFDPKTRSVVIGPARLTKVRGDVPNVLEYGGTSDGSTIAPRPFMRPAEQELRTKYVRLWKDAMM